MTTPPADVHPAAASSLPALMYGDMEQELAATRRILERVPDGRNDWRPHEKSMPLGRLATHVAELPAFARAIIESDEMDLAAGGRMPPTVHTTAELLALFDASAAAMRAAVGQVDAAALDQTWTLRMGDQVLLARPRGELVRNAVLSHLIHHRAQLGVYLRLLGVPIPGLYGPSADEQ